MTTYYIEYKERRKPEWERYGTHLKFNSVDELISYYKEEFDNIRVFRLGTSESDSCWISWGEWYTPKDYPCDVFAKYVKER